MTFGIVILFLLLSGTGYLIHLATEFHSNYTQQKEWEAEALKKEHEVDKRLQRKLEEKIKQSWDKQIEKTVERVAKESIYNERR